MVTVNPGRGEGTAATAIQVLVLDAFGATIRYGTRLAPYRRLLSGRGPGPARLLFPTLVLTRNVTAAVFAAEMGMEHALADIERGLADELGGIDLVPEAPDVLARARRSRRAVGVCSNLAQPYGSAVRQLLLGLDACVLSYEIGAAKPDSASRKRRLVPTGTLAIHRSERRWLEDELAAPFSGPTVVVTHHAPHRNSLADAFADTPLSAAYVSELPASFFEIPVLWVHGHTHTSFDYRVGNCRVVCNPRGYPMRRGNGHENEAFDPNELGISVGNDEAGSRSWG